MYVIHTTKRSDLECRIEVCQKLSDTGNQYQFEAVASFGKQHESLISAIPH
jgi:hypothetical protein